MRPETIRVLNLLQAGPKLLLLSDTCLVLFRLYIYGHTRG